jgi:D-glycero-D-manno-heptose 1,7-bisphosphate phosphatase
MGQRAIFLDRDGTLNEMVYNPPTARYEAPYLPGQMQLLPGAAAAARRLQDAGYLLFIVSNQPDFAKGKTTLANLQALARDADAALRQAGVTIAHAYYCFHHPLAVVAEYKRDCPCRKPGFGALLAAQDEFDVDLSASWMAGDYETDVICGRSAGCRTALLAYAFSAYRRSGVEVPTVAAADLADAAAKILSFKL